MGLKSWPIFSILIFISIVLLQKVSSSRSFVHTALQNHHDAEKPIRMTVYYETLCPDSLTFLEQQILPLLENATGESTTSSESKSSSSPHGLDLGIGIESLVDLKFVPYGKAITLEASKGESNLKNTFVCQHGPLECEGNKLHSCALSSFGKSFSSTSKSLMVKFLICSMKNLMNPRTVMHLPLRSNNLTSFSSSALELCLEELELELELDHLNQSPSQSQRLLSISSLKNEISQCIKDKDDEGEGEGMGTSLLKHNGELTIQLDPKLYFVPWVTFNGIWSKRLMEDGLEDLRNVVCQLVLKNGDYPEIEIDKTKTHLLENTKILGCPNQNQNYITKSVNHNYQNHASTSTSTADFLQALKALRQMQQQHLSTSRTDFATLTQSQSNAGPVPAKIVGLRDGRAVMHLIHPIYTFEASATPPAWQRPQRMINLRDRRGFLHLHEGVGVGDGDTTGGSGSGWRIHGSRAAFASNRDLGWRRAITMI